MIHAQRHHDRDVRPSSRAGLVAFCLVVAGLTLVFPSEIGDPDAPSTLATIGFACLWAAVAVVLYAITVVKDRSWLTLASLLGPMVAVSPVLLLAGIVAAVAISMNLLRDRRSGAQPPRSEPRAEPAPRLERRAPRTLPARIARAGALILMVAANVAAFAVFLVLMFLSGSGVLDVATLLGSAAGFVGAWWRYRDHPIQAAVCSWLVVAGMIGVLLLAGYFGLLGA